MLKIKDKIFSLLGTQKAAIPSLSEVPEILSDRRRFDQLLYTPLSKAWKILEERRNDKNLETKILRMLGGDIPDPMRSGPKGVLFRNLISPNYEVRRFVSLLEGFKKLDPLFFEYTEDKFTSNNPLKHSLGKMHFMGNVGKKGGMNMDATNIIDFVESDGKPINDVKTKWGEELVVFHHRYFNEKFRPMPDSFFNGSRWLMSKGSSASEYYKSFFLLFVRHGVLFENMMLDPKEKIFAEKVFLPAFLSVYNELGLKPLIVALGPTDIEGDRFWMCYPAADKEYVDTKMI